MATPAGSGGDVIHRLDSDQSKFKEAAAPSFLHLIHDSRVTSHHGHLVPTDFPSVPPINQEQLTNNSRLCGFTLIEVLVVITIIIILAGMLFPAYRGVQNQAKKTQAKNDLTQIVTAVNAFYTEYGRYPTTVTGSDATYGPGGGTVENGSLFNELRGLSTALNTRQIVFISPPDAKDQTIPRSGIKTATGGYYDPWGTEYAVAMDADYDNNINTNPYGNNNGAGTTPLRQGVIAWSLGGEGRLGNNGDGKFTDSDDVISWQ